MENNEILESFFDRSFENRINRELQELNYVFETEKVLNYVNYLISIPIEEFLKWEEEHTFFVLESIDMPQISKFESAFYDVVFRMIEKGDSGFRFIDIGKMLQNDGKERKEGADRKYGENHAKTAEYLGYLYNLGFYYYVSCFGYILGSLDNEQRSKLFTRLLIRTNLFKAIYLLSLNGTVSLRALFDILSDKTYLRRLTSTKVILEKLLLSSEYNFNEILSKIVYK